MADNYNILEPVTTPSGTTQRSIRALEISSELHAAAVLVHGTTGAVLLGDQTRANSLPVTIAQEDRIQLSRFRESTFASSSPGGIHTPSLESWETNDITVGTLPGTTPVAADFSFTAAKTVSWNIPVVRSRFSKLSVLFETTTLPVGGTITYRLFSEWSSGHTIDWTQLTTGSLFRVYAFPAEGAAVSATPTAANLAAMTIQPMPWSNVGFVRLQVIGAAGITAGAYAIIIIRSS